jgi:site-specific DNA-methyltransferase (adenine-specific)
MSINIVYNDDYINIMSKMKDNEVSLAITDPPYGQGQSLLNFRYKDNQKYNNVAPSKDYFEELFRISRNQIIWGGNYFTDKLYVSKGWVCWYKHNPVDNFSDFELAWSSFQKPTKLIDLICYGAMHPDGKTIHPSQKPVALYKWILKNYAKKGDKIFDSHVGSGSLRIAAYELGFDFEGCELDADYWQAQEERFKLEKAKIDGEFYLPENEQNLFNNI